jgi:hypothetical protein
MLVLLFLTIFLYFNCFCVFKHKACELGLNERNELIDPRSDNVKTKIPVIFVDDSMRYLYRTKTNRYTDILIENFRLLNYSALKVTVFFSFSFSKFSNFFFSLFTG